MDGAPIEYDGRPGVRFTRRLAHPPAKVWRALTDSTQLAAWFPAAPELDLSPGAKIRFELVNVEAPVTEGELIAAEEPRLLEYSWETQLLRWELAPAGDGTLLVFTVTFDPAGGSAQELAGWHVCLDALGATLAGQRVSFAEQLAQLDALLPRYDARF